MQRPPLAAALTLSLWTLLAALAGASDTCMTATPIVGTGAFAFDGTATHSASGVTCPATGEVGMDEDEWFEWTSLSSGSFRIDTCGSLGEDDTIVALHTGCAGTCLDSNDDFCGGLSSLVLNSVTAGDKFWIQVADAGGSDSDELNAGMLVITGISLMGDDCANAMPITGEGAFPYDGTTLPAFRTGVTCPATGEATQDEDLWFEWTATAPGDYRIDTCTEGTEDDTVLAIHASCGGPCLQSANDECGNVGFLSELTLTGVLAGQTYYIQVADWALPGMPDADPLGSGTLTIENLTTLRPPGNTCAAATPVHLSGTPEYVFDTTFATSSGIGSGCGDPSQGARDIWFSITAPKTGNYTFSTCGSSFDTLLSTYAECTGLTCGAFSDDACGSSSSLTTFLMAGEFSLIQVSGRNSAGGLGVLTVEGPSPANDECADAQAIAGAGLFPFDLVAATDSGSSGLACMNSLGLNSDRLPDDVWFLWTAPCTSDFVLSTCGLAPGIDTKLAVYDGASCGGSALLACNDDESACPDFASELTFSAVDGATYLIQVGLWAGENGGVAPYTQGAGQFSITPATPGTQNFCLPGAAGAQMSFLGSLAVSDNNFTLVASPVPNTFGLFFFGPAQIQIPFGNGFRCVGGGLSRIQPAMLPTNFPAQERPLNLTTQPGDTITPGSCWNFQYWFRDGSPQVFDLSDGLGVTFGL